MGCCSCGGAARRRGGSTRAGHELRRQGVGSEAWAWAGAAAALVLQEGRWEGRRPGQAAEGPPTGAGAKVSDVGAAAPVAIQAAAQALNVFPQLGQLLSLNGLLQGWGQGQARSRGGQRGRPGGGGSKRRKAAAAGVGAGAAGCPCAAAGAAGPPTALGMAGGLRPVAAGPAAAAGAAGGGDGSPPSPLRPPLRLPRHARTARRPSKRGGARLQAGEEGGVGGGRGEGSRGLAGAAAPPAQAAGRARHVLGAPPAPAASAVALGAPRRQQREGAAATGGRGDGRRSLPGCSGGPSAPWDAPTNVSAGRRSSASPSAHRRAVASGGGSVRPRTGGDLK